MFDVCLVLMGQLIDILPGVIALWVIFDLTGSLLFDKR